MDDAHRENFLTIANNWLTIGNELCNKDQNEKAINAYSEGLKNCPNYPPILFNLACLYEKSNQLEAALELINQYLLESEDKFALYKKSIILKKLNRNAESTETFRFAESIEGSPSENFCMDERKKAADLLNLKIENIPEAKQDDAIKKIDNLQLISNEQLVKDITSDIKTNYPNYEKFPIQFLIQNYFEKKEINLNLLSMESMDKIRRVEFEVEHQLLWDLVPHRIKTISSEEISLEFVEFIKKDLMVKGKVWVRNYSKLFWRTQEINKFACPTEIQIKLMKAEGLAQEIFDNEQSELKKTGKKSQKPTHKL